MGLGSGIRDLGSRIRDPVSGIRKKPIPDPGFQIWVQGPKRHRIPDPGPGSATLVPYAITVCTEWVVVLEIS
jgi:hypothetical protein